MSSKKQKSCTTSTVSTTFTQLIESEKTNNYSMENTNVNNNPHSDEEEEEEEELLFEEEEEMRKNNSPQPQPDLLAFLHVNNNVKEVQQQGSVVVSNKSSTTGSSTSTTSSSSVTKTSVEMKQSVGSSVTSVKTKNVAEEQVTSNKVEVKGQVQVQQNKVEVKEQLQQSSVVAEEAVVVHENENSNKLQRKKPDPLIITPTSNNNTHIALPPTEAKVFAKVCVAELRRSFGSLISDRNNSTDFSSLDWNAVVRSRSSADEDHRGAPLLTHTGSSRPRSLILSSPSWCFGQLKSSFSKFDKLQKKTLREQEANGGESNQKICKSCSKEVFLVELIKAEKASWHKNCFRCSECQKQLSVDTYSSHEGKLYCKPHHRSLFLPKQVILAEDPAESLPKPKPSVIIRENEPEQLHPDVVRASDSAGTGLEDLQIDVRSRFELFEKKTQEKEEVEQEKMMGPVKRSPSVLAKLAKYEKSTQPSNGILTEELLNNGSELNGDESPEEDDSPLKIKSPLSALQEIMQQKQLEEVRNKWKSNDQGDCSEARTAEAMAEERKNEMARFRSRLCQGKSTNLKTLYEKGIQNPTEQTPNDASLPELESLRLANNRKLKELFEKGEIYKENDENEEKKEKLDMDVFEGGVGKEGRKLWEQMDREQMMEPTKPTTQPRPHSKFTTTTPTAHNENDVVRADSAQDEVKIETESLREKFRFFEQQKEEQQQQRQKVFRITPPRDDVIGGPITPATPYIDPDITTTTTVPPEDCILTKSKTASKMLSVFRELEAQQDKPVVRMERKLKEFTPPRGDSHQVRQNDSEEENSEEEEDDEREEGGEGTENGVETEKDAFLKEVGSLARARSLRARFEKWEQSENDRNKSTTPIFSTEVGSEGGDESQSIESASILRAKFEEKMRLEKETKASKAKVVVRRFV